MRETTLTTLLSIGFFLRTALGVLIQDTGRYIVDNATNERWVDAEAYCLATYGSHLASLDAAGNTQLRTTITNAGKQGGWIGINNMGQSVVSNFAWTNGDISCNSCSGSTQFGSSQSQSNLCGYLNPSGDPQWNAVGCTTNSPNILTICNKRPYQALSGQDFSVSQQFTALTQTITIERARSWCLAAYGSTLASFRSAPEASTVLARTFGNFWIGYIQENATSGRWSDGSDVTYQPTPITNSQSTEQCTSGSTTSDDFTLRACNGTFTAPVALCNNLTARVFTKRSYNYFYVDLWMTQENANTYCSTNAGTRLASIHDTASLNEINTLTGDKTVWIGLYDKTPNGASRTYEFFDKSVPQTNALWLGGAAPTTQDPTQSTVRLENSTFQRSSNLRWLPFVCNRLFEKRIGRIVLVSQSTILQNFSAADAYCQATFGTHLASIHSAGELTALRFDATFWIGLNNFTGPFRWLDGSAVDFFQYAPGTENTYNGPCYVAKTTTGFESTDCGSPLPFACNVYDATLSPTFVPSDAPSAVPSIAPTSIPSFIPTNAPSSIPTVSPSVGPSSVPSASPSSPPSQVPSNVPSALPSLAPSAVPSVSPTKAPTKAPTSVPTVAPSSAPTATPTFPTNAPTMATSNQPNQNITQQTVGGVRVLYLLIGGLGVFVCIVCVCFLICLIRKPRDTTPNIEKDKINQLMSQVADDHVMHKAKSQTGGFVGNTTRRTTHGPSKATELGRLASSDPEALSPTIRDRLGHGKASEADPPPAAFANEDFKYPDTEGGGTTTSGDLLMSAAAYQEVKEAPALFSQLMGSNRVTPGLGTADEGAGRADAHEEESSEESGSTESDDESGSEESSSGTDGSSSSGDESDSSEKRKLRPQNSDMLEAAEFGYGNRNRNDSKQTVMTSSTGPKDEDSRDSQDFIDL